MPRFKFFNAWTSSDSCEALMANIWSTDIIGNPMQVVQQKLKTLQPLLKIWNKQVFGDVHQQVTLSFEKLDAIQLSIDQPGLNPQRVKEKVACLA